jgi:NRAMP (natural resistance-associated macrophage protein)-like metal ion transporter
LQRILSKCLGGVLEGEIMKKINLNLVLTIISLFGPAVLISVELFDPASIVAATASGAAFGFEVLWAAFHSGILLIGIQEISARLVVFTGKTLAENIHNETSPTFLITRKKFKSS